MRTSPARSVLAALAGAALFALPARSDPSADALAARAAQTGSVRAIVELAVSAAPESGLPPGERLRQRRAIAAARASAAAALAGHAFRVRRAFRTLPYAALELDAAAVRALAASPWVASLREERLYRPLLDTSVPLVQADFLAAQGLDGAGQTIAVIDTGVDGAHPNLAGKIAAEACFASGASGPSGDCPNGLGTQSGAGSAAPCDWSVDCRHGTHVAGIAAGEGPQYDGVAPGAAIVAIQVASRGWTTLECGALAVPCPIARESDVLAGLEEVYDTFRFAHAIAAVNVSLGGQTFTSQASCDASNGAMKTAVQNLRSTGIATAIAAGNDGLDDAVSEPACVSTAISVGAVSDLGGVAAFSNAASFLSLWGPGIGLIAPRAGTTLYTALSGTSQATPHVSGAFALLRQGVPGISVTSALNSLRNTGVAVSHPTATTKRIRIRSAFESLTVACADGIDTDGDGTLDLADPGCASAQDDDERGQGECDNGMDDDLDGWADAPDDPGCDGPASPVEDPQCQDGVNNDMAQDLLIDFDGGASRNGGVPLTAPDPQCGGHAWAGEQQRCGLGAELALALAALGTLRRWRARATRSR
jgi:subtilisin family serine protease